MGCAVESVQNIEHYPGRQQESRVRAERHVGQVPAVSLQRARLDNCGLVDERVELDLRGAHRQGRPGAVEPDHRRRHVAVRRRKHMAFTQVPKAEPALFGYG
ncbi:UDP-galactopyranose mutase [Babesia caballi]|uniref:UDP-galactopyranose mutase n=1 Tax=Babesia caballi TaxID=5871 RepID=A0AAV4M0M1_BABCB|nr:UDP-galactopyranose mutase [Babesia caballi]